MRVRMEHWPTLTVSMSGTSTLLWLSFKVCQQTGRSCSAFLIKSRDTHNWPCWRKKFQNLLFTLISLIFSVHVFESRDQILILLIFWAIVIRLSQIIFSHRHLAQFIIYVCFLFASFWKNSPELWSTRNVQSCAVIWYNLLSMRFCILLNIF